MPHLAKTRELCASTTYKELMVETSDESEQVAGLDVDTPLPDRSGQGRGDVETRPMGAMLR
ncbi:MAG: hypothetical protein D6818_07340 [Bacteroidetes bacterium]|nr:MAG: hypothetical protein D6818_07340 [Bacteroidota bacterium]